MPAGPPSVQPRPYRARIPPNILGGQIHPAVGNDAPEHGVREARSALRAGAHELHTLTHRRPGSVPR